MTSQSVYLTKVYHILTDWSIDNKGWNANILFDFIYLKKLEEEGKVTINPEYGYEFSHTLETQIRGQLKNGLAMIDFYESCDKRNRLSRYGNDYIATLCIKL